MHDELNHFDEFLPDLRVGHVHDPLRCVLLQTLLRDGLHDFDTGLSNLRHRKVNDLLVDVLGNTFSWNLWDKANHFNDFFLTL